MKKLILGFAISGALFAVDAPTISDHDRAAYWKSIAEFNIARDNFMKAQNNLQAAFTAVSKTCGETFVIGQDATGDIVCVVKKGDTK